MVSSFAGTETAGGGYRSWWGMFEASSSGQTVDEGEAAGLSKEHIGVG